MSKKSKSRVTKTRTTPQISCSPVFSPQNIQKIQETEIEFDAEALGGRLWTLIGAPEMERLIKDALQLGLVCSIALQHLTFGEQSEYVIRIFNRTYQIQTSAADKKERHVTITARDH